MSGCLFAVEISGTGSAVRTGVNRLLRRVGLQLVRYEAGAPRMSLDGSLGVAASLGSDPATIVDVGAAQGRWSRAVSCIWPHARYILVDPLAENEAALQRVCTELENGSFVIAAAADQAASATLHVGEALDGSSLLTGRDPSYEACTRSVTTTTVDTLRRDLDFAGPILLKADVQGAELKVLLGAQDTLASTELVVLEVLLFDFYGGQGAQLAEVVSYMHDQGFVIWDLFDPGYRPLDNALCQIDAVFVRDDSLLRISHLWATPEQHERYLRRLRAHSPERVSAAFRS